MQADFVAVPPFWTVGAGHRPHAREPSDLPEHVLRDLRRRPDAIACSAASISAGLLNAASDTRRSTIMDPDRHVVLATEPTRRRWRASSSATI